MSFVKSAWRVLVGIKDALVLLLLLLFFAGLYTLLSFKPAPPRVGSGALVLKLDGVISEQPAQTDAIARLSGSAGDVREYRLRDVVHAIETASDDSRVKAIVLDLDFFLGGGQVALERVGAALDKARAKKPVLAHAIAYTDDSYQLAAHASEIWVDPFGGVMLRGPGGTQLFYKGLIDRLGINAHVYRVGTYKSFVEPYIRADQSPEAKENSQTLANALWADWQRDVAKARPKAKFAALVAEPLAAVKAAGNSLSRAALSSGMVDKLGGTAAFGARVAQIAGPDAKGLPDGYARITLPNYLAAHPVPDGGQIGVLTVAGDIVDGQAGPGKAAGDTIANLLREALAKDNLKALVVRIDSPGGSVLASERIREAVMEARNQGLPVVVSMGNVAASGGYWVSTAGQTVFAEPATITGSIGVFGILPSFENTLAKIGVTTDGVKTTSLSGEPNVFGGTSPQFDQLAQAGVEDIYGHFLGLVGKARGMAPAAVDRIAQGRVWDGGAARQLRLIDRFGGLDDAVAEAARLAKVDSKSARIDWIDQEPDRLTAFLTSIANRESDDDASNGEVRAQLGVDWLSRQGWMQRHAALQLAADLRGMLMGTSIQAACLECRTALPARPVALPDAQERGWWSLIGQFFWKG